jgi:ABC-type polysaccharide/polyol phosphate export permease
MLLALRSLLDMARTNIEYHRRTLAMARVDMAKRYSGSTLGIFWAIVRPTVFIAVFWFAVAVGFRGGGVREGVPVVFWLIAGIVPWFFVSESINQAGGSIRKNSHLVTRIVYPVATIPTFSVLSLFYVHLMVLTVAIGAFVLSGQGLTVYFIQLPYFMLCAVAFAVVSATFFSTLTAISKDVSHLIVSIMTVLFWVTPIIWPLESVEGTLRYIIMLNPITYIVQGYRDAFVLEQWFFQQWEYTLYFWGFVAVFALLTSYMFAKLEDDFADIL